MLLVGFKEAPILRQSYPRVRYCVRAGGGATAGRREETMCGGNNVVGCFADCQPRSGILLSTPLSLTATGTARRRKSPLIWSWKERGKVILGCLRRWVIRPQSLARTLGCSSVSRRQVAAPRRAWGAGQLVNNPQDPVPQGGDRPGWGWAPVSARGRRCGGRRWGTEEGKGGKSQSIPCL